jgi:hypothetical protein
MQITLRMDDETAAMLREEAGETGATVGELVAEMGAEELERVWGSELTVSQ